MDKIVYCSSSDSEQEEEKKPQEIPQKPKPEQKLPSVAADILNQIPTGYNAEPATKEYKPSTKSDEAYHFTEPAPLIVPPSRPMYKKEIIGEKRNPEFKLDRPESGVKEH